MNDCEHRKVRIEGSWGANASGHLMCMDCGQTHALLHAEADEYVSRKVNHGPVAAGEYLAHLLKEEDRLEADPDVIHE